MSIYLCCFIYFNFLYCWCSAFNGKFTINNSIIRILVR
nr:MAG TPA: hypothetical protein [Caudoviricetes sp.]